MEKGGEGGCCNTATYSTEEGGAAMERKRGERREGGGKVEGGKVEGVVAVILQHTQRKRKPWLWMEREQIIMLLKIILEITCTLLNKRVNLYRGVFLYSLF